MSSRSGLLATSYLGNILSIVASDLSLVSDIFGVIGRRSVTVMVIFVCGRTSRCRNERADWRRDGRASNWYVNGRAGERHGNGRAGNRRGIGWCGSGRITPRNRRVGWCGNGRTSRCRNGRAGWYRSRRANWHGGRTTTKRIIRDTYKNSWNDRC
ncbi:hypothetical protein K435DRAFT_844281 [Dendrothele bispora CBS 962.96]|uniref:Uncharacterized protein n=1 Tax=Dendrothele bispora (strain CBS 962.96) TaxID=1314807 RepID=A0A4S8L335_DENBC|nr:hypothetical protein K435DRAFT_844281 [Dendrothele bispora CBS 962.96]